ncbi:MAG: hypothetical protein JW750_12250 [Anaerolineaceae bacterium]|nr:hypothetical protein [Anaerolineaceae bacterium]
MLNNLPPVRNLRRWRELQAILFRYGFDFLIDIKEIRNIQSTLRTLHLPFSLPESNLHELSTAERVRRMLQDLGPTFVKLGQILSSRSELLPEDWVVELAKLQDDVPPFSFEKAEQIIIEELGEIKEHFLFIEPEPIAAASIGQVHYAILNDFSPVMIKVQRPNVVNQIQSDLEFVRDIAKLLRNTTDLGKKYGTVGIAEELIRVLMDELDYTIEATNADRLRKNMAHLKDIHVPYIYWELTTSRVLTMEAIDGFKINNLEKVHELGIEGPKLARNFIRSILHQAFIDGFFHADPHPGNLMVEKGTHRLVYIDTGMVGSLLPEQRDELGDIVQAILRRDTQEILRIAMILGVPFQPINENKLRREMAHLIHQYLEAPLDRIEVTRALSEILTLLFQSGIRLPPELGIAAKALLQGEAVARTLDPDIVIIQILKDLASEIYLKKLDPQNAFWTISGTVKDFQYLTRIFPRATANILDQLQDGRFQVKIEVTSLEEIIGNVLIIANRLILGLVLVGITIGSALAMSVSSETTFGLIPILGMIGFILSIVVASFMFLQVWSAIGKTRRQRKKVRKLNEMRNE